VYLLAQLDKDRASNAFMQNKCHMNAISARQNFHMHTGHGIATAGLVSSYDGTVRKTKIEIPDHPAPKMAESGEEARNAFHYGCKTKCTVKTPFGRRSNASEQLSRIVLSN